MHDLDVIVGDMLPLEGQDLTGSHAGDESQPNQELLAKAKDGEDLLDLFGREDAAGGHGNGARGKQHFGRVRAQQPIVGGQSKDGA